MNAAGLRASRRRHGKPVHVWRPRRAAFGELVMMDSSPFRWLEDRGPACQLIALIDDASSACSGPLRAAQFERRKSAHPGRLAGALRAAAGAVHR